MFLSSSEVIYFLSFLTNIKSSVDSKLSVVALYRRCYSEYPASIGPGLPAAPPHTGRAGTGSLPARWTQQAGSVALSVSVLAPLGDRNVTAR